MRWIKENQTDASRGTYLEPSKQLFGDYLATYLDGLRLAPSTIQSYKKMARLHIKPYIGSVPLASITPARLDALYRQLKTSGRRIGKSKGDGLSPRTVRYTHTILSGAMHAAVEARPACPQPVRPGEPGVREAGEGTGDAPVDRVPAGAVPSVVAGPAPGAQARVGTSRVPRRGERPRTGRDADGRLVATYSCSPGSPASAKADFRNPSPRWRRRRPVFCSRSAAERTARPTASSSPRRSSFARARRRDKAESAERLSGAVTRVRNA